MINVKNLTKKYGKKTVLDNVSFSIQDGDIVGFLGPNGAGKSTTMNIITGYISATAGEVEIDGINIMDKPIEYKKKIGYLPEIPPLYVDMTVREYLEFVCELKKADKSTISAILSEVKIENVADRLIKNLSKGYRQRVGIAQALIGDPEILILDEPTVGLDPQQIIDIRGVISELGKKKTLIISSHILAEISQVCNRVLIINKGQIVAEDTPKNLSEKVSKKNKYIVRIEGEREEIEKILGNVSGIEQFEFQTTEEAGSCDYVISASNGVDIRKSLFKAVAENSMAILMFKNFDISLEDIFITVTGLQKGENADESDS